MAERLTDAGGMTLRMVSEKMKKAIKEGGKIVLKNAEHLHCLASGLRKGDVTVKGGVGDYVGSLNSGASITVYGKAGNFVADNMTDGRVVVNGDVGGGAGQYCYGGFVVIKGSAGDFSGTMNKGATMIITGNVGHDACTYMVNGEVVILGDAARNLANYLIGGSVYVGGKRESLGHNTKVVDVAPEDIERLNGYFREYKIDADPRKLRKIIPETSKPFYKEKEAL